MPSKGNWRPPTKEELAKHKAKVKRLREEGWIVLDDSTLDEEWNELWEEVIERLKEDERKDKKLREQ